MAIVAPILRLLLLFINIYETFKVLKLPSASSRGARRNNRSLQRKRDMKGCLAVWIVWCCLHGYEQSLDPILRMFVPFYNEVKSVVLLFLLISRARGAEPIFLHIIRPIIKPYTASLDWAFHAVATLGDFVFLLGSLLFYSALNLLGKSSEPDPALLTPNEQPVADPPNRPQTRAYLAQSHSQPPTLSLRKPDRPPMRSDSATTLDFDETQVKVREWQAKQQQYKTRKQGTRTASHDESSTLRRGSRNGPTRRVVSGGAAATLASVPFVPKYQIWHPPRSPSNPDATAARKEGVSEELVQEPSSTLQNSVSEEQTTSALPTMPGASQLTLVEHPMDADIQQNLDASSGSMPKFWATGFSDAADGHSAATQEPLSDEQMDVDDPLGETDGDAIPIHLTRLASTAPTDDLSTTALSTRHASSLRTSSGSSESTLSGPAKKRPGTRKKTTVISPARPAQRKRRIEAVHSASQRQKKVAQRPRAEVVFDYKKATETRDPQRIANVGGDGSNASEEGSVAKRRKLNKRGTTSCERAFEAKGTLPKNTNTSLLAESTRRRSTRTAAAAATRGQARNMRSVPLATRESSTQL